MAFKQTHTALLPSFKVFLTIQEHNTIQINSLLVLKDGRLASCSDDNNIKIYDSSFLNCDIEISKQHNYSVQNLSQLDNGTLLSCDDWDSKINLWEISQKEYHLLHTLEGHKNTVNNVIPIDDDRIASCSWDCTIIIWNSKPPYNKISKLRGHKDIVNSIILLHSKEVLVSGSSDQKLIFWDMKTYKEIKKMDDIPCYNFYEVDSRRLVVGGYRTITVVNPVTYQVEAYIEDEDNGYYRSFIMLKNGHLLCGCGDGFKGFLCELDLWDYKIIEKREVHKKCVNSLVVIDENSFASCSQDSLIKIWRINNINTKCI